ncbi:hypothetical protein [Ensifer canadensis]|uniref:hypothetical protein n=1 Tax=Ensifer canadensis TaxID=555315 RepID=UPI0035E3F31A
MDVFHLRIFQRQVLDQCRFLLLAAAGVNEGLQGGDSDQTLFSIQNLLNAGANISKMLWGQRGKHEKARKRLRDSIGIADVSLYAKSI